MKRPAEFTNLSALQESGVWSEPSMVDLISLMETISCIDLPLIRSGRITADCPALKLYLHYINIKTHFTAFIDRPGENTEWQQIVIIYWSLSKWSIVWLVSAHLLPLLTLLVCFYEFTLRWTRDLHNETVNKQMMSHANHIWCHVWWHNSNWFYVEKQFQQYFPSRRCERRADRWRTGAVSHLSIDTPPSPPAPPAEHSHCASL